MGIMAEATRRFGEVPVYGSLAYDLNYPGFYQNDSYAAPRAPTARPRTRTESLSRSRGLRRSRQSIAPAAIIGLVAAAFLFVTGITAQVNLLRVSNDSVELESRLAELREQQDKLRISYESAFNLAEIEEYATLRLGMQKPNASQIAYIDTSAPDKAMVVTEEDSGFVDRVSDFLSGLGTYF